MQTLTYVNDDHAGLVAGLSALLASKEWSEGWFGQTFADDPQLIPNLRQGKEHSDIMTADLYDLVATFRATDRAQRRAWKRHAELDEALVLLRRHALAVRLGEAA